MIMGASSVPGACAVEFPFKGPKNVGLVSNP